MGGREDGGRETADERERTGGRSNGRRRGRVRHDRAGRSRASQHGASQHGGSRHGVGGRGRERVGRAVPPAARGDDHPARAAAGDPAGHARQPHREHRAAADRGGPRRGRAPVLGGDRLHPRVHDHHAVLRQARRHVRAEEALHRRDHHLPHRLGAVRPVAVHGRAHHVPRAAGPGGRRADGRRDGDARRHRGATRARPLHELHDGGHDARHHRRPAARRLHHDQLLLALDLLHQPASGRRRAGLPDGRPAHAGEEGQPQDRLPGRVTAGRGGHVIDPARDLGRNRIPLGIGADHRPGPARRGGHDRVLHDRDESRRADAPAARLPQQELLRSPWR